MHMSPATGSCYVSPYKFSGYSVVNQSTTSSSGTALGWGCDLFATGTAGLDGYWTMPANGSDVPIDDRTNLTLLQSFAVVGNYFHQFSPGSYTLVAEDLEPDRLRPLPRCMPEPVEVVSVTGRSRSRHPTTQGRWSTWT